MNNEVSMPADGDGKNKGPADSVSGAGERGRADPGPNAPARGRLAEQTRVDDLAGHAVEIVEESGTAAAEASGDTGVEGQRRHEGEQPGSG